MMSFQMCYPCKPIRVTAPLHIYTMAFIIKRTNKGDFKGPTCSSRSVHLTCVRKNGSFAARNLLAPPVTKGWHPPGSSFFHSNIHSPLICQTPGQGRVQKAKNLFNSQDLTEEKKGTFLNCQVKLCGVFSGTLAACLCLSKPKMEEDADCTEEISAKSKSGSLWGYLCRFSLALFLSRIGTFLIKSCLQTSWPSCTNLHKWR